jgi:phosphopantothenoylcysteine decarboxylase/phosphopantothenate--cysteine ligase
VVTAEEMYKACHHHFSKVTIAVLSAAVADYKPKKVATEKIKKKDTTLEIELAPTKDILASLGAIKQQQYLVGFALETNNEIINALSKLESKNLDAIILNSLKDKGAGFATDTNKVTFIDHEQRQVHFELKSKTAVANDIMNEILNKIDA